MPQLALLVGRGQFLDVGFCLSECIGVVYWLPFCPWTFCGFGFLVSFHFFTVLSVLAFPRLFLSPSYRLCTSAYEAETGQAIGDSALGQKRVGVICTSSPCG